MTTANRHNLQWRGDRYHYRGSMTRRSETGPAVWQDSACWLPLVLAYTGCRRERVAKAQVTDVEEIDGNRAFTVRDIENGQVKFAGRAMLADQPDLLARPVLVAVFTDALGRTVCHPHAQCRKADSQPPLRAAPPADLLPWLFGQQSLGGAGLAVGDVMLARPAVA